MNYYEIITEEQHTSIIFTDTRIVFTDIDSLFRETNIHFAKILRGCFLDVSFDFTNKYNKTVYTHAFLQIICDKIKNQELPYKLCFYSNSLTKDPFRNKLLAKLKRIFGFKVMEDILEFSEVVRKLKDGDSELVPALEIFFEKENKPKTFKHIKKYLEKEGLKDMGEFFKDVSSKLLIMG